MSISLDLSALKIIALLHDPPFKPLLFSAEKGSDVYELLEYVIGRDRMKRYEEEGAVDIHERLALYIIEEVAKKLQEEGKDDLAAKIYSVKNIGRPIIKKCDVASSSIDRSITYVFSPSKEEGGTFVNKIIFKHPGDLSEHDLTREVRRLLYDESGHLRREEFKKAVEKFIELISKVMIKAEKGYEYHALWRVLPASFVCSLREAFGLDASWATLLPADTRSPSSTIFDHLYATSSLLTSWLEGETEIGLLYWEVENKQEFISISKLPRDLWSGSYLISILTFYVLVKLADELGPCSIIRPLLHATPLYDAYLASKNINVSIEDDELTLPVIPGAVMVILPGSKVNHFSSNISDWYREAWKKVASIVMRKLSDVKEKIQGSNYVKVYGDMDIWEENAEEMPYNVNIAYIRIPWNKVERLNLLRELGARNLIEHKEVEQAVYLRGVLEKLQKISEKKSSEAMSEKEGDPESEEFSLYEWGVFVKALTSFHYTYSITKSVTDLKWVDVRERRRLCNMCWRREPIIEAIKADEVRDNKNLLEDLYETIKKFHKEGIWIKDGERLCLHCLVKRSLYSVVDDVLMELVNKRRGKSIEKRKHYPSTEEIAGSAFASTLAAITTSPLVKNETAKEIFWKGCNLIIKKYNALFGELPICRIDEYEDFENAFQAFKMFLPSLYEEHYLRIPSSSAQFRSAQDVLANIKDLKEYLDKSIKNLRERLQVWNSSVLINLLKEMKKGSVRAIVKWCSDYLAMVKGDGDSMSDILSGRGAYEREIFEIIPRRLLEFFTGLSDKNLDKEEVKKLKDISRSISKLPWLPGISYTYTVSRALNVNSIQSSKHIQENGGLLIYSGGDDILAMLPPENALRIIGRLRKEFSRTFIELEDRVLDNVKYLIPGLGSKASQSFGIIFFDAFFPLRKTVEEVSVLVEEAKKVESIAGKKDSLVISYRVGGSKAYIQFKLIEVDKLVELLTLLAFSAVLQSQNKGLVAGDGGYKFVDGFSEKILRFERLEEYEDLKLFRSKAVRGGVDEGLIRELEQFFDRKFLTPRGQTNLLAELLKAALCQVGAIRESSPIALGELYG
ncbi:MAG: type III-B CRISPR-associated protein Cas10/Cmr2 [Nitrososphaerota archaeon]